MSTEQTRREWLDGLKVGDDVALRWFGTQYVVYTVTSTTPNYIRTERGTDADSADVGVVAGAVWGAG